HTLRLLTLPELLGARMDSLIKKRKKALAMQKMVSNVYKKNDKNKDVLLKLLEERKSKFECARKILMDKEKTAFIYVLNPERLPLLETEMSLNLLKSHDMEVAGGIINRITPKSEDEFLRNRRKVEETHIKGIRKLFQEKIIAQIPLMEEDIYGLESLKKIKVYFE
ncbi:MAG: ArsA family ATPase, partial [bacterium]